MRRSARGQAGRHCRVGEEGPLKTAHLIGPPGRCALLGLLLVAASLTGSAWAAVFQVDVERGQRRTSLGDTLDYALVIPRPTPGLPPPPWPAVVLLHGFGRDHTALSGHARALGRQGVIALTPDSTGLIGGAERVRRNIATLSEHLLWLRARSADPRDVLFGRVDRSRLGLAGHSAGGGVALEAAIDSQATVFPVTGLALLDAVPFPGADQRIASMRPLALASLRSEPSFCNAKGRILGLLARLPFPAVDVQVAGGTHCDPENPSSALCGLICGESTPARQELYQRLLVLFFRDVFRMPHGTDGVGDFLEELARLERAGAIARRPIGSAADGGQPDPGDAAGGALPGQ